MRRRKLFTLAAGVSAVLNVGACVLWVRSYWVADSVSRSQPKGYWELSTNRATVGLSTERVFGDGVEVGGPYGLRYEGRGSMRDRTFSNWLTVSEWQLGGF